MEARVDRTEAALTHHTARSYFGCDNGTLRGEHVEVEARVRHGRTGPIRRAGGTRRGRGIDRHGTGVRPNCSRLTLAQRVQQDRVVRVQKVVTRCRRVGAAGTDRGDDGHLRHVVRQQRVQVALGRHFGRVNGALVKAERVRGHSAEGARLPIARDTQTRRGGRCGCRTVAELVLQVFK